MSIKAVAWALDVACPSPLAKLVLLVLADAHNGHTGDCYPKVQRIIEASGLSESSVKRSIRELEAERIVSREPVMHENGRTKGVRYFLACDGPVPVRGPIRPPQNEETEATVEGVCETSPENGAGRGSNGTPEGGLIEPLGGSNGPPSKDNRKDNRKEEPEMQADKPPAAPGAKVAKFHGRALQVVPTIPAAAQVVLPLPDAKPAAKPKKEPKRGTRLPEDFELTEARVEAARKKGLHDDRIEQEFGQFRDHWLQSAGGSAVKRDWEAAWRFWAGKAATDFRAVGRPGAPGNGSTGAGYFGAAMRAASRFAH